MFRSFFRKQFFLAFKNGRTRARWVADAVVDEAQAWLPANPTRRKRVLVGLAGLPVLSAAVAFATAPSAPGIDIGSSQMVTDTLALDIDADDIGRGQPLVAEERVRRGDSVGLLLGRLGVNDPDIWSLLRTDSEARKLTLLRPGKAVSVQLNEHGLVQWLRYWHSSANEGSTADVLLIERKGGRLIARNEAVAFERQVVIKTGKVRSSLYGATDDAGIPDAIANQLTEVFSAQIDFHRDLKKGDSFRVVYEMMRINGEPVRPGRILAAEFTNGGEKHQAFWHEGSQGGAYYQADGKSLRQAFLRSPLEFSRVTSGFTTARFHPILQNWRAHKGVDYGAPRGTRVKSTADGTISFAGTQSGYGNLVVVKHYGAYSTAYAHLSGFAPGLRIGAKVSQGDVLGYVGSTGWATGPHLHYEFRINNVQQNPLAVALPPAMPLDGPSLAQFKRSVGEWQARLELSDSLQLARAE
ncbi:MAG: peptidoglycan DD-metalloendopeptidase family protein [Burkholderiaceae bacterium]|jgi:murein DD-endopeptidase MepM/ murein hydrolase activator NlpD